MNLPTLSVVIPNYNHARFLPRCVNALLRQSFPATEIILIDDGSTDNSLEVMEGLARQHPSLRVHRNDGNRGTIFSGNRGFALATGEYLYFHSADDEVKPGFFEKSMNLLARYPQAGFCAAICEFHDVGSGLRYHFGTHLADHPRFFTPGEMASVARQGRLIISSCAMIFRSDAVRDAGVLVPQLKWHCDWWLFIVAGFRNGFCFVPEVLAMFEKDSRNSLSGKGMRDAIQQREVLRQILELLCQTQNRDVFARVREGAALAPLGKTMLRLILTTPKYRPFLNAPYLRLALWWIMRIETKKLLPPFVTKAYLKMAGHTLPTPS